MRWMVTGPACSSVARTRVSPITFSGSTVVPNSCEATSATFSRRSALPPSVDMVADVPMHRTSGAAQASLTRRISIATSAPCRPR